MNQYLQGFAAVTLLAIAPDIDSAALRLAAMFIGGIMVGNLCQRLRDAERKA